jgi:outer membrane protein TolC
LARYGESGKNRKVPGTGATKMIYKRINKKGFQVLIISVLGCFLILTGCKSPADYKTEADEKVYNILDQKWEESLGSKANYKISDSEPAPNDIQVDKVIPESGVLELRHAVAVATAYNHQYQLEREQLYISALDLLLIRHEYEPQFFGTARGGYAKVVGEDMSVVETGFESERLVQELIERQVDPEDLLNRPTGAGVGFNQLLSTGALVSTEVAVGWWRILAGDLAGDTLASILRASVVQPLLRGRDRAVVMENLTQAERNTLYQLRSFNRFRQTFVVSIINQYYGVLLQHDIIENACENSEALGGLYNRTEKLAKVGRVPRYELERIGQEKLRARDILIQAEKNYKQVLDEFKISLGLPVTAQFELDEGELEVLRESGLTEPAFSESDAIDTALGLRLDLANSADWIVDAYRKIAVAADGFNAGLNIRAEVGIPSTDATGDAEIFADNIEAFLELELPLDRALEQNIYRKALIAFNQRRREYEESRDLITLEVRQAWRDLIEAAKRYRVQSDSIALAQKRFRDTSVLVQYGRANTRRILDAQDNLFDARNAASQALVNYAAATLNFYCDTGVLQVRPDGMWQRSGAFDEEISPDDLSVVEASFLPASTEQPFDAEAFIEKWLSRQASKGEAEPTSEGEAEDAEAVIQRWMSRAKERAETDKK